MGFFCAPDPVLFKLKALCWANQFSAACLLDSNNYTTDAYTAFDALIAADAHDELKANTGSAFERLNHFLITHSNTYKLGYFSYDLKNEIECLQSNNSDGLQFPDLYFFVPKNVIKIVGIQVTITAKNPQSVWDSINQSILPGSTAIQFEGKLNHRLTYAEYEQALNTLKKHIYRGDIYEANLCQEFFAENAHINPLHAFIELNKASPTPFASFFKNDDHYIISASPERFLRKRANKLISQPIKGTRKRCIDSIADEQAKHQLRNDPKEVSENVMIVDLVRNDMTKNAKKASVQVEELCGIYSFPQVHQMISTVVCEVADQLPNADIIRNMFPMGSMTGAPKIRAMELIEQVESTKRGIYSGSVGYFAPNGDFDFNVIIRTLLYNAKNNYLSFQVGSAITIDAHAEQEYEECMIKAEAIIKLLVKA